jgi:long-chain fatty aldehyde decarbonylase
MEFEAHWGSFLDEVTSSGYKHYLWLRSLSYLEYIGYRKMVKALDYHDVHKGVFRHLTDEIRHSFMLKELAEKVFIGDVSKNLSLQEIKAIAEDYFQGIDAAVHRWVFDLTAQENPYLCYILTSYLVEIRAMKVYPQYFSHLNEAPAKYIIQQIIKDESEHLSYLEDRLPLLPEFSSFKNSHLAEHEARGFLEFVKDMKCCIEQQPAKAAV